MDPIEERTIALAGVLQACKLVQALARQGFAEHEVLNASLQSVLVLDALSTASVYGGVSGVRTGLSMLEQGVLNSPVMTDLEVLRYAHTVLTLQTQLYRDEQKFGEFGLAVERLSSHSRDDLVSACSEVYQSHISVMRPQIIVQGEQSHLQTEGVPEQVRAMLLAALRSAVLWQQKGGGRFRLLWERTRMQNAARNLLSQNTH